MGVSVFAGEDPGYTLPEGFNVINRDNVTLQDGYVYFFEPTFDHLSTFTINYDALDDVTGAYIKCSIVAIHDETKSFNDDNYLYYTTQFYANGEFLESIQNFYPVNCSELSELLSYAPCIVFYFNQTVYPLYLINDIPQSLLFDGSNLSLLGLNCYGCMTYDDFYRIYNYNSGATFDYSDIVNYFAEYNDQLVSYPFDQTPLSFSDLPAVFELFVSALWSYVVTAVSWFLTPELWILLVPFLAFLSIIAASTLRSLTRGT